jgi:hypothetical protein
MPRIRAETSSIAAKTASIAPDSAAHRAMSSPRR